MRNNVNYAETGVLTALEFTSTIPQIVLGNFYRKSLNSIHTGETEAPYAYVIPADNEDPTRVAFAVHILRMQGIEVGRAKADIKLSDGAYPAGSLVVKLNQPYGRLAHTLLSKQVDPNPELTTYDDAAWTLGLMTHTTIKDSADKSALTIAVDPVDIYTAPSKIEKSASAVAYAVPDHGSPNLITLRFALKDADIQIAEKSFTEGKMTLPAGSFIIPAAAFDSLASAGKPLGLDAVALTAKPTIAMHKAGLPRIAMFSTWNGTQDVGWVRYAFDQYKIPYDLLYKEQVLAGNLRAKYDILLIPTQARNAKQLINDIPKTKTPYAYVKDDKFKFLGDYGSSDDISRRHRPGGPDGVPEVCLRRRPHDHPRLFQLPAARLRPGAARRSHHHVRTLLRSRPHRGSRDRPARQSHLLRLLRQNPPRALGCRAVIAHGRR